MIYGNKFLPKKEESISVQEFGVESIVYNEYYNYKSLLESCSDKSIRPILEAQTQILYEISFKDIIEKIKEAWKKFKEWVKGIWNKIFDKKKIVKEKYKKAEEDVKKAKQKVNEEKNTSEDNTNNFATEDKKFTYEIPTYFEFELLEDFSEEGEFEKIKMEDLLFYVSKKSKDNINFLSKIEKRNDKIDSLIKSNIDINKYNAKDDEDLNNEDLENHKSKIWSKGVLLKNIIFEEKEDIDDKYGENRLNVGDKCLKISETLCLCADRILDYKVIYDRICKKIDDLINNFSVWFEKNKNDMNNEDNENCKFVISALSSEKK